MAKIRFLDDVVEFNHKAAAWECLTNPDAAELVQTVLEDIARSPDEAMHYCAERYGAEVLEWDQPASESVESIFFA